MTKKDKRTNNYLQNITQIEQYFGTQLKTGGDFRRPGRIGSSCSTCCTRRDTPVTSPKISRPYCDCEVIMSLVFIQVNFISFYHFNMTSIYFALW